MTGTYSVYKSDTEWTARYRLCNLKLKCTWSVTNIVMQQLASCLGVRSVHQYYHLEQIAIEEFAFFEGISVRGQSGPWRRLKIRVCKLQQSRPDFGVFKQVQARKRRRSQAWIVAK